MCTSSGDFFGSSEWRGGVKGRVLKFGEIGQDFENLEAGIPQPSRLRFCFGCPGLETRGNIAEAVCSHFVVRVGC